VERLTKRSGDGKGYIPCHWMESFKKWLKEGMQNA
jgi:hypothetical protein